MRNIDNRFIQDLLRGELSFFGDRIKKMPDVLSLAIRNGYINIYYKGGSLLKITQRKRGYSFSFDEKYCKKKGDDSNFELFSCLRPGERDAYILHFDQMMGEMDRWFQAHPKAERDYQHQLLVNNPEIVDIEYQIGRRMRLDMLWFADGILYIIENKYGNGAIGGKSGMSEHYKDICEILTDPQIKEEMLDSVCHISRAKKALGLTDTCIEKSDIKGVKILFLMANYTSKGTALSKERAKMDGSVPAGILMTSDAEVRIDLKKARNLFGENPW